MRRGICIVVTARRLASCAGVTIPPSGGRTPGVMIRMPCVLFNPESGSMMTTGPAASV